MSTFPRAVTGIPVVKASQALPATATATLFTVSGGAVVVTALLGLVTTALGATATNLSLGTANDAGTSIATATAVTSAALGTWLTTSQSSGIGGALVKGTAPFFSYVPLAINPFLVDGNITWTTSATDTGQIRWYLWYIPIDASASVS